MHTVLGLLGVLAFIACVIALAAGMTWTVVRYTPTSKEDDATKAPSRTS